MLGSEFKNRCLTCFVCAVIGLFFFLINWSIPYVMDDETYRYFVCNPPEDGPHGVDINHPIHSFVDIIPSQINHYLLEGGRFWVHIIVQSFCAIIGKDLYNVISSFLIVLIIFLLGKITLGDKSKFSYLYFLPFTLWILLMHQPRCLYNGISHGVNYLWTTAVCLLFLWRFLEKQNPQIIDKIWLYALALFAGSSHEVFAVGIGFSLFAYCLVNRKNIKQHKIIASAIFFLGAIVAVFAPGNFNRAGSLSLDLISRANMFFNSMVLFLLLILIIYFTDKYTKIKYSVFEFIKKEYFYIVGVLGSSIFILVSGSDSDRSLFCIDLLVLILLVKYLQVLVSRNFFDKLALISIFTCICLLSVVLIEQKAKGDQYRWMYTEMEKKENIERAEIYVPAFYTCFSDIVPYKYICKYPLQKYTDLYYNQISFETLVYQWLYKTEFYLTPDFFKEDIKEVFLKPIRFPGNNNFVIYDNVLLFSKPVGEDVELRMYLGNFRANSLISFGKLVLQKCHLISLASFLDVTLPVENFEINGEKYQFIRLDPNSSRIVERIDML